jgi:hypothetical protein
MEEELKVLLSRLANVDLLTQPQRLGRVRPMEILLLKLQYLKLKMYQEKGHLRPHLHVDYGRKHHVASYAIDGPERLEGTLDTKYDQQITEWIIENRGGLLRIWSSLQSGADPSMMIGELTGDA